MWYDKLFEEPDELTLRSREIYHSQNINVSTQPVYSEHEYTLISQAEETVFAEDETGAPHVFTIAEWNAINKKNDGTGFLLIAAVAAGLMLL